MLRWECPRCGVDLTDPVQTGKVMAIRSVSDPNGLAKMEEQVRCPSCERLVRPERIESD